LVLETEPIKTSWYSLGFWMFFDESMSLDRTAKFEIEHEETLKFQFDFSDFKLRTHPYLINEWVNPYELSKESSWKWIYVNTWFTWEGYFEWEWDYNTFIDTTYMGTTSLQQSQHNYYVTISHNGDYKNIHRKIYRNTDQPKEKFLQSTPVTLQWEVAKATFNDSNGVYDIT